MFNIVEVTEQSSITPSTITVPPDPVKFISVKVLSSRNSVVIAIDGKNVLIN